MNPKPAGVVVKTVLTGATVLLVGASPARRNLTVTTNTARIWISDNPAMANGEGLCIRADIEPADLCACHLGDWITRALYARADGANSITYVVEGFEPLWHEKENPTS